MIIPILKITLSTLNPMVIFTCSPHFSNICLMNLHLSSPKSAFFVFVFSTIFYWYISCIDKLSIRYYCINKSHRCAALPTSLVISTPVTTGETGRNLSKGLTQRELHDHDYNSHTSLNKFVCMILPTCISNGRAYRFRHDDNLSW